MQDEEPIPKIKVAPEDEEAYLSYESYLEKGDPFFRDGLSFEEYKEQYKHILKNVNKCGSRF